MNLPKTIQSSSIQQLTLEIQRHRDFINEGAPKVWHTAHILYYAALLEPLCDNNLSLEHVKEADKRIAAYCQRHQLKGVTPETLLWHIHQKLPITDFLPQGD